MSHIGPEAVGNRHCLKGHSTVTCKGAQLMEEHQECGAGLFHALFVQKGAPRARLMDEDSKTFSEDVGSKLDAAEVESDNTSFARRTETRMLEELG